jgi:transposase
MRPAGSPEELQRRRERAITLLKEGHGPVEVAQIVGVERRSVRRWKAAYRRRGESALSARRASGRPLKLAVSSRKRLERVLLKGAKAAGFTTDLWTCPRIAQVVWKRFGVSYHRTHVGRILRSLGWSAQRPERRAVERDEEAIRRWVKKQWPRVKKNAIG